MWPWLTKQPSDAISESRDPSRHFYISKPFIHHQPPLLIYFTTTTTTSPLLPLPLLPIKQADNIFLNVIPRSINSTQRKQRTSIIFFCKNSQHQQHNPQPRLPKYNRQNGCPQSPKVSLLNRPSLWLNIVCRRDGLSRADLLS